MTNPDVSENGSKHAVVVLVRGLPGSGKTFIAEKAASLLPPGEVVLLDPDSVDENSSEYKAHVVSMQTQQVDEKLYIYRYLRGLAYSGITEGKTVIWNQPFTNLDIFNKMVANFENQAERSGVQLSVIVVEVEVNPSVARQRVQDRKRAGGHGPTEQTFERFVNDYRSYASEGYNVITVSGEDIPAAVDKITQAISNLR